MSLFFPLLFPISMYASPADRSGQIDQFMTTLHQRGQFNGSIIVAVAGNVIYRNAFSLRMKCCSI